MTGADICRSIVIPRTRRVRGNLLWSIDSSTPLLSIEIATHGYTVLAMTGKSIGKNIETRNTKTMKPYYVYIMSNVSNTTVYVGVTNDLKRRVYEHKNNLVDGFTKRYNLHKLVYFEQTDSITSAIEREKQLKGIKRDRKNYFNPEWADLDIFNYGKNT